MSAVYGLLLNMIVQLSLRDNVTAYLLAVLRSQAQIC